MRRHARTVRAGGPRGRDVPCDSRRPGQLRSLVGGNRTHPRREARKAAEICGAEYATLGFSDAEINAADRDQQHAVIDVIRDARPDLIITHSRGDYMGDHNEISRLVFDCSFYAALPLYETEKPYHTEITPIYFMETVMATASNRRSLSTSPRPSTRRSRCSRPMRANSRGSRITTMSTSWSR